MKTAMQDLIQKIEYIASFNSINSKDGDINYQIIYQILYSANSLLEKEKNQIIEARDGCETSSFTTGKDYYDLNFNHHIESEANTYTNFTPHNANAVAEYNEGLKNFTPNK